MLIVQNERHTRDIFEIICVTKSIAHNVLFIFNKHLHCLSRIMLKVRHTCYQRVVSSDKHGGVAKETYLLTHTMPEIAMKKQIYL